MLQPVLALTARAVNLDARKLPGYLVRVALVTFIVMMLIMAHAHSMRTGIPGLEFFAGLMYLSLTFMTLAGIAFFPSVITEEKEETTLGLLQMTGLNALSIILGKGTHRVIMMMMLVLAQFPFTLLAVTLGGVSLDQILAAYATLLAYAVFLGGVALLSSVLCRRTGTAMTLMTIFAGLLFGLGAFAGNLLDMAVYFRWIASKGTLHQTLERACEFAATLSPGHRIYEIMQTGFAGFPVGGQALSSALIGVLAFLVAWAVFNRLNRTERDTTPGRLMAPSRRSRLAALGVGRAWKWPLVWKEFHFGTGGHAMMLTRFFLWPLLYAASTAIWPKVNYPVTAPRFGGGLMFVMAAAAVIELLLHAARTFAVEIRQHTLQDLSVLPMSAAGLFYSKWLAGLLIITPYAFWFAVGAAIYPEGLRDVLSESRTAQDWAVGWAFLLQTVLLIHAVCYMSVVAKYGALPLGLILTLAINVIAAIMFGVALGDETAGIVLAFVTGIFLIGLLHHQTIRRIEFLGGV